MVIWQAAAARKLAASTQTALAGPMAAASRPPTTGPSDLGGRRQGVEEAVGRREPVGPDEGGHGAEDGRVREDERRGRQQTDHIHLRHRQDAERVRERDGGDEEALGHVAADDQQAPVAPVGERPGDHPEQQVGDDPYGEQAAGLRDGAGGLEHHEREHDRGDGAARPSRSPSAVAQRTNAGSYRSEVARRSPLNGVIGRRGRAGYGRTDDGGSDRARRENAHRCTTTGGWSRRACAASWTSGCAPRSTPNGSRSGRGVVGAR